MGKFFEAAKCREEFPESVRKTRFKRPKPPFLFASAPETSTDGRNDFETALPGDPRMVGNFRKTVFEPSSRIPSFYPINETGDAGGHSDLGGCGNNLQLIPVLAICTTRCLALKFFTKVTLAGTKKGAFSAP